MLISLWTLFMDAGAAPPAWAYGAVLGLADLSIGGPSLSTMRVTGPNISSVSVSGPSLTNVTIA